MEKKPKGYARHSGIYILALQSIPLIGLTDSLQKGGYSDIPLVASASRLKGIGNSDIPFWQ
jgi:hypothetical protein